MDGVSFLAEWAGSGPAGGQGAGAGYRAKGIRQTHLVGAAGLPPEMSSGSSRGGLPRACSARLAPPWQRPATTAAHPAPNRGRLWGTPYLQAQKVALLSPAGPWPSGIEQCPPRVLGDTAHSGEAHPCVREEQGLRPRATCLGGEGVFLQPRPPSALQDPLLCPGQPPVTPTWAPNQSSDVLTAKATRTAACPEDSRDSLGQGQLPWSLLPENTRVHACAHTHMRAHILHSRHGLPGRLWASSPEGPVMSRSLIRLDRALRFYQSGRGSTSDLRRGISRVTRT